MKRWLLIGQSCEMLWITNCHPSCNNRFNVIKGLSKTLTLDDWGSRSEIAAHTSNYLNNGGAAQGITECITNLDGSTAEPVPGNPELDWARSHSRSRRCRKREWNPEWETALPGKCEPI